MNKLAAILLKVAITAGILMYLGWNLDWNGLLTEFKRVHPGFYAAACLVYVFSVFFVSMRWQLLLRIQGIALPFLPTLRLTFIGLFFNVFLLGSAGGDLTKIYYANQAAPGKKALLLISVVSDRLIGLLVLVLIMLLVIPLKIGVIWKETQSQNLLILATVLFLAGLCVLTLILVFPSSRIPQRWILLWQRLPYHSVWTTLLKGVREHGRAKNLTFSAFLLSALSFAVIFSAAHLLAIALDINIPFSLTVLMVSIVFIIISLPVSFGGHGLREALFVILFGLFGITAGDQTSPSPESAVAFSVLLFGLQLIPSLIGSIIFASSGESFRKLRSVEHTSNLE